MPSPYTKLYIHDPAIVDLEFRNLYSQIATAVGVKGADGNPGAQGAPGTSAVLSLKALILEETMTSTAVSIGVLPQFHAVIDIFGIHAGGDWHKGTGFTEDAFQIGYAANLTYYADTTVSPEQTPPYRVWPLESFYTGPAVWMGEPIIDAAREIIVTIPGAVPGHTSDPGRFYIAVNYLHLELLVV